MIQVRKVDKYDENYYINAVEVNFSNILKGINPRYKMALGHAKLLGCESILIDYSEKAISICEELKSKIGLSRLSTC